MHNMTSLPSNLTTTMAEHLLRLAKTDQGDCDPKNASCNGYIKRMVTFYRTTGGWIMLGIVLCGISCMIFTFIQNFFMKKPGLVYKRRGKSPISWIRKDTLTKIPRSAPVRKNNVTSNGFAGFNGITGLRQYNHEDIQALV